MKGLFQSNKIYCISNIFACILCTGYLYTGYCSVNNDVHHEKTAITVETETEPLSEVNNSEVKKVSAMKTASTKTVVTKAKTNNSSKKYVPAKYDSVTGSAVVNYAKKYLGLRYVSGGNSLSTGTDCSGFTKLIYREFGINLSRSVKAQAKNGSYVKKSDLKKGDLIFYGYKSGVVSHVAIYMGDGMIIHQSTPKSGVKINSMNMMVYITARRVITERSSKLPEEELGDKQESNTPSNSTNNETNNTTNSSNNTTSGTTNENYTESEYEKNDTVVEVPNEKVEENTSSSNSSTKEESNNSNEVVEDKTYTNNEYGSSN